MPETRTPTSAGMETVDETVARIRASLNAPGEPGPSPGSPAASTPNPVLEALTARLTAQGQGIASSSQTNLQQSIADAIRGTERAGDLNRQRIESERGREVDFARDRAGATYTTALEGRSGYATQVAGLRELTETTEKSIRDLDQRYQEALLTNDANTASQIADLRIKKLEFAVQQEQNFYQNLFQLAGLEQGQEQMRREDERFFAGQKFEERMFEQKVFQDERNMMLGLAAEYGVPIGDGDNIDTMIGKISPFVDERRALELQEIKLRMEESRAKIAEARAGAASGNALDPATVSALAMAFVNGDEGFLAGLRGNQAGQVYEEALNIRNSADKGLRDIAETSTNPDEFRRRVMENPDIIATEAQVVAYESMYADKWQESAAARRKQESKTRSQGAQQRLNDNTFFNLITNPNRVPTTTS